MITAKEIRVKRAELQISQRYLAQASGITAAYLNQIENEIEKPYLTEAVFKKVEDALIREEKIKSEPAPVMKFGKLSIVKEMRSELKHLSENIDDYMIMKLYDYAAYLQAEKEAK